MGVRDLVAVAKKHAPSSIIPYPSIRSFAGSRFAIDASLLSTKMFFAGRSNQSARLTAFQPGGAKHDPARWAAAEAKRCARAWYFFLLALKKEGIQPIVVFDGATRPKEKAKENERRRLTRRLQRLRGEAEGQRGERLRQIRATWEGAGGEARRRVAGALRDEVGVQRLGAFATKAGVSDDATSTPFSDAPAKRPPLLFRPPPLPPDPAPSLPPPTSLSYLALSEPEQALVRSLLSLYASFLADSRNPVYSKVQLLVVEEEQAFFRSLLFDHRVQRPMPPGEPAGAEEEPMEEATVAATAAVPGVRPAQQREDAGATEDEAEPSYEELEEVIAWSDKLGASHISRSVAVPRALFAEVRALILSLGVPYLEPSPFEPYEAEGVCSALFNLGLADYVVSEDTDTLVYGAPILRRISTSTGESGAQDRDMDRDIRGKQPMAVMDPVVLREQLGLTKEEFLDFALLCGTDFTERIPRLGPHTALKLVRQHSNIEAILEHHSDRYVPIGGDVEEYLETIRDARALFLNLPDLPLGPSQPSPSADLFDTTVSSPPLAEVAAAAAARSSFSGTLEPRPPSPDLPALLRRLGLGMSDQLVLSEEQKPLREVALTAGLAVSEASDEGGSGDELDTAANPLKRTELSNEDDQRRQAKLEEAFERLFL
ncbi:hypothetical protein JCM10213_006063 [Rhodosporidiobolus nylandii]